jgi:hypothetical protein
MKRRIVLTGLLALLLWVFECGKGNTEQYKTADIYRDLRQQVFAIDPGKIGLAPAGSNKVWGVLMETGYPKAVATLVTIADGTVSLYFSNGGGIIGVGQHEGPRKACKEFLSFSQKFFEQAAPTKTFPLPKQGNTRFYFLTFNGIRTVEFKEDDLGNNRLPLSPLFHKAHAVITQARIVDEKRRVEQPAPPDRR